MSAAYQHETYAADLAAELVEADDGISAADAHADLAGPNPGHVQLNTDWHHFTDDPWQETK